MRALLARTAFLVLFLPLTAFANDEQRPGGATPPWKVPAMPLAKGARPTGTAGGAQELLGWPERLPRAVAVLPPMYAHAEAGAGQGPSPPRPVILRVYSRTRPVPVAGRAAELDRLVAGPGGRLPRRTLKISAITSVSAERVPAGVDDAREHAEALRSAGPGSPARTPVARPTGDAPPWQIHGVKVAGSEEILNVDTDNRTTIPAGTVINGRRLQAPLSGTVVGEGLARDGTLSFIPDGLTDSVPLTLAKPPLASH